MKVIPAVDIMGSKVVRLSQGDPSYIKRYEGLEDPLQVALKWERAGATCLHIVDLDAATTRGDNRQLIHTIIRALDIPVQMGGGIRSRRVAEEMLNAGAERVIVATLAFEQVNVLKALMETFGCERIMVALDYDKGRVRSRGWKNSTKLTLETAFDRFMNLGVEFFLLTAISRDGLLAGPDYATIKAVSKRDKIRLFVAGGVSDLNDLRKLKTLGVTGVIVGKALYEGRFGLQEALETVRK